MYWLCTIRLRPMMAVWSGCAASCAIFSFEVHLTTQVAAFVASRCGSADSFNVRFGSKADIPSRLLRYSFSGVEFNYADQRNQNENGQYNGLRDREGRLGLRRSQRSESRDLHEALHDQNKDVKIQRRNSGDCVNPAPRAHQVLSVQSIQRD